jgi:poly [ADP-ribose] polymerase 2/3/4
LVAGSLSGALSHFQAKFKDKTGHKSEDRISLATPGKYTYLERSYEDSSDLDGEDNDLPGAQNRRASKESVGATPAESRAESKLSGSVQRLMALIFN